MDTLTCCLSKVLHLCVETCIFVNQLVKFRNELTRLYSSPQMSPSQLRSILQRFAVTLADLNRYHTRDFSTFYSTTTADLSRLNKPSQTMGNDDHELINNLHRLNTFLGYRATYSEEIFYHLHKLSITCTICGQYRRLCTNVELASRFTPIRTDLLISLKALRDRVQAFLMEINREFERRRNALNARVLSRNNHRSHGRRRSRIDMAALVRTVCIWLAILVLAGCYMFWPIAYETQSNHDWPLSFLPFFSVSR